MSDIPRKVAFNGHGWRRQGQPMCGYQMVRNGKVWECERIKNHKGSHCCDNASETPKEP